VTGPLQGKVAVITGASRGIGAAISCALSGAGATVVRLARTLAERREEWGIDLPCDVTDEVQVQQLVRFALDKYGLVDLYCSNAGAGRDGVLIDAPNELWQQQWELHVMAHIYATRALLPGMIERGDGYFLITASAAGLLAALSSGPYTVTKAAAIKLAEFIAITHGDDGIKVSVLCPQGVNTAMAPQSLGNGQTDGILEPEELADTVIAALSDERFHVLPHPEVAEYVKRKGNDIDRWILGMQRLRRRSLE
jgi:NAD(P)-dependent dehydrogenase (short-subunit alcohol dehydrogenase family)